MDKDIDNDVVNQKVKISPNIKSSFEVFDFTLDMVDIPQIYKKLENILPDNEVMFNNFDLEKIIACETICASICHKINWDFLRKVVYQKTVNDSKWVYPQYLKNIKSEEVFALLCKYTKKNRIRSKERSSMLREIGTVMYKSNINYTDIFFDQNMNLKQYKDIVIFFKRCSVFAGDPEEKKLQLLMQSLSDYPKFYNLERYYNTTVDYHLIRLFLRRGIIRPTNKYGENFIFNDKVERTEATVGALRNVCSKAIKNLCIITSLNLKKINRIEWWIGRTVCTENKPDCLLKRKESSWLKNDFKKCPYYYNCYANNYNKDYLEIKEPKYKGNSY